MLPVQWWHFLLPLRRRRSVVPLSELDEGMTQAPSHLQDDADLSGLDAASDRHPPIDRVVLNEYRRQAQYSFNLQLALTAVSAGILLVGIGLLFSDRVSGKNLAIAAGVGSNLVSMYGLRMTKEANERLDKLARMSS